MAETQNPENVKNWLDSVGDQNASFILRAISRICCGLPKRKDNERYEDRTCDPKNRKTTPELQEIFSKICQLALDYSTVKNLLDYPVCSLLIQEVVECNRISKGNKHRKFLGQILESMQKEDADGDLIVKQWEGKNSSRIWDALVTELDENDASQIWMSIIQPKFDRLSLHPSANFVLQRFIEGSHSFDLATDILDEIGPRMSKLVDSSRTGVICSLVKCIRNHEQLQETLLKNLRATFKAEKSSNKTKFIYNLLTLNTYNGIFDCKVLKPLGCVLVKELLSLEKRKTIVACLMEMPAEHIRTMSIHGPACRVLQSAIESPTLDEEVKNKIIGAFESYWVDLIANPYSSHLFDRIWDYWGVREKQDLLKKLVPIRNESRQWKFAMLKADMKLFRDDRKAWVAKMKQQKELLKEKANR
ncbi:hypothetical protein WR25_20418 [Diploscapter pachys]|uniref:Pumilio domain-containing protein NOP9 n=1 Tax=Diploscapter pachys TaxID=2018661 RepID=A0A2A2JME0_9BILA|nr:hypothetical protein WR25_20418 [Diploscapter pachys]